MSNGNARLRQTLLERDISHESLAESLRVDPKTVQRWVSKGRTPYARTAHQVAKLLKVDVSYLWPELGDRHQATPAAGDEVIACYPGRGAIPESLLANLLAGAERSIDIVGDFGLAHLVPGLRELLTAKAASGVAVQVVLPDPAQALDPGTAAAAAAASAVFQPLAGSAGIKVSTYLGALHTVLLRIDGDIIARMPLDGCPAAFAPFLHLRTLTGGPMGQLYLTSIEAIKDVTIPVSTQMQSFVDTRVLAPATRS